MKTRSLVLVLAFLFSVTTVKAQWLTKADEKPFHERERPRLEHETHGIGDALKWYWGQRAFGLGYIPKDALQIAEHQTAAMRVAAGKGMTVLASQPDWSLVGPTNAGGRVEAIAIDPHDANTIYIGAANGGVWKTTNAGGDWTPLTDQMQSLAMGSLAIDPQNTSTIYAGTGELPSTADSYGGYGLLRSTDGGTTWTSIGPSSVAAYSKIIVNPKHSNIIYAAAGRSGGGIMRSTDGGKTWPWLAGGLPQNTSVSDLALSMNADTAVLYAGVVGKGVYVSTNGGDTWTLLQNLPWQPTDYVRVCLDVDPTNSQNVVVLDVNGSGGNGQDDLGGIQISNDGGQTWTDGTGGGFQPFYEGSGTPPQGWYDAYIRVDPSDFTHMLVGGVPFWETNDGGQTWNEHTEIHVDHHDAQFAPSDPTKVYVGCDGGVYYSPDGGRNFNGASFDIPISEFYTIGIDQSSNDITYGGLQDNGVVSGSTPSDWAGIYGGDGAFTVPDPNHSGVLYFTLTQQPPVRNANGNLSSMGLNPGTDYLGWLNALHLDAKNNILYFGTDHLYFNTNPSSSNTWVRRGTRIAEPSDSSTSIQTIDAFGDKQTVLCGTSGGRVFLTTNSGTSFTDISTGLPGRWVTCVKFNPSTKTTFYATVSGFGAGHVFKTTDNGAHWLNISSTLPNIPVNSIEMDPTNPTALYIGTDVGVFFSPNDGGVWVPYGTGLPNVAIDFMDIQATKRVLRVGTHGRSVWEIPLVDDVTGISLPAQRTVWTLGDTGSIVWHNFGSSVTLDLSLDGGATWQNIGSGITGTSYTIQNVIYPASENAIVRVSDGTQTLMSPLFSIAQQKAGQEVATVAEYPFYLYDVAYDKDDNVLWGTNFNGSDRDIYKIDPDKGTLLDSVKIALVHTTSRAGFTGIKYDPSTKHLWIQQVNNTSDPYAWQSYLYEVTTSGTVVQTLQSPAEYGTGVYVKGDTLLVADRMVEQIFRCVLPSTDFTALNPLDFSSTRNAVYGSRGLTYDSKIQQYLLGYTEFDGTRQSSTFNGSDILFLDPVSGEEQSAMPMVEGSESSNIRALEWDPRGNGTTAWMSVLSSSSAAKLVKVALTDGPSSAPAPLFTLVPDPIDFGGVDTGKSMTIHAQLHNNGNAAGTVKSVSIVPESGVFTLGTLSLPATLPPGDTLGIDVTFTPNAPGPKSASLVITTGSDNTQTSFQVSGFATINGAGVNSSSRSEGWDVVLSPNPARDRVTVTLEAERASAAQLEIYDATGREVHSESLGMIAAGEHESELSTDGLPNGIYFVRVLGSNGEIATSRLAIAR